MSREAKDSFSDLLSMISSSQAADICYTQKMKTLDECDRAIGIIDSAARNLAAFRFLIASNKAKIANDFAKIILPVEVFEKISRELSENDFFELGENSAFFSWFKQFREMFFDRESEADLCSVSVDRYWRLRPVTDEDHRRSLLLTFMNGNNRNFKVEIFVPLPGSISPDQDGSVYGGVDVKVSTTNEQKNMLGSLGFFAFRNEYDIKKIKKFLSATLGRGNFSEIDTSSISNAKVFQRFRMKDPWYLSFDSGYSCYDDFRWEQDRLKQYSDEPLFVRFNG